MELLIFIAGIAVTGIVGAAMVLVTPLGTEAAERSTGEDPAD